MNILSLKDPQILFNFALNRLKDERPAESVALLEKIEDKSIPMLKILQEAYRRLKDPQGLIKTLEKIALKSSQKADYWKLIETLLKYKKKARAFHFLLKGSRLFEYDPDFKKQMVEILVKAQKYRFAILFLKKNQNFICREKFYFYKGYIYREMGKRIRSLIIFRKMVKQYPFNILYRYMLSTVYQSFKRTGKSEEHLSFIRDFMKQMPKMIHMNNQNSFPLLMQQMMEEI